MGSANLSSCQFDLRPYRRAFVRPLLTRYGEWSVREGAIVKLTARDGRVSYGEIAPIPWFGSETLAAALDFCQGLQGCLTFSAIEAIPDTFPACRFGLESAWNALQLNDADWNTEGRPTPLSLCGLLPAGEAVLQEWRSLLERGYSTLKWKIGVFDRRREMNWLRQLRAELPTEIELRLDVNGGLDREGAVAWLQLCDRLHVEFLEQPLPPSEFASMLDLAHRFATPIALDESVANLPTLRHCYERGWRDIFVVKPSICGSPSQLLDYCRQRNLDVVLSSALETAVGQTAAIKLARKIGGDRAIGFGVDRLLEPTPEPWPQCLWQTS